MRKFLATAFSATLSLCLLAQVNPTRIKGTVSGNQKPIEGATITLHTAGDSTVLAMTASGKQGEFMLTATASGKYLISASAVSFQTQWSIVLEVKSNQSSIQLPEMDLPVAANQLQGVVVTNAKPAFEQKLDRMVVNVAASPSNAGLTALEVLERTPGVTVDKDGIISLKGKNGVMILIDGKPTYLSNADVSNMLRSLPSSQLEVLEIMTNPPAKYDAAGNAGIINIKTKKSKARGFNGNLSVGAGMGYKFRSNNSISMNYRKDKFNLFTNYNYNYNGGFQEMEIGRKFFDPNTGNVVSLFDQNTRMDRFSQNHNVKLGVDYYSSKKTTFGILVTGMINPSESKGDNTTFIKMPDHEVDTRMHSISTNSNRWENLGVNLNFRHQFDSTGREITADADFLGYMSQNNQLLSNEFFDKFEQPKANDEIIRGSLPSDINIYSLKVDYVHPLKKDVKLEAGAKSSYVSTDNDALYELFVNNQWETDLDRTNQFKYTENINALYINSRKQFNKKWSGQLGLRLENTIAQGRQVTTGENFDRNYTQLFPTAYVGYKASDKNQFSISYGRRIQRPSYQDMNPFYFFLDKYTFQVGNPYLRPQFSHNIDLTHTFKGFLTTTLNYTRTNDIINQILEQNDAENTTYVKMGNIAKQQQIGMSVSAGFPVTKWWTANLFMNGFYNEFKGPINGNEVSLSAPGFMTNIQNMFKFEKGWGAEVSGFYRSRAVEGVFTALSMGQINFAGSKQIMKGKGSVRLLVRDPFDLQMFRGSSKYGNVDVKIRNEWDNRFVNLSFTYRFGKPVQGQQQRKRSGSAGDEQNRIKMEGN